MAFVNEKQQEQAAEMEAQQGAGAPAPRSAAPRTPRNVSFADAEKLIAKDRGQHAPMPPMRGATKGSAKDALAFFTGGFQNP